MVYPFPTVMGGRGRLLVPANCGVGVTGEAQFSGYAGPNQWVPGGVLEPIAFKNRVIVGLKNVVAATDFMIAISGVNAQNVFTGLIAPGINNGAPLYAMEAGNFPGNSNSNYGGPFTWWWWQGLPAGGLVAGELDIW